MESELWLKKQLEMNILVWTSMDCDRQNALQHVFTTKNSIKWTVNDYNQATLMYNWSFFLQLLET